MIDALIAGHLYGIPEERTSKAGRPFTTGKARVALRNDESVFISLIAFRPDVAQALTALGSGDAVALSGELKVSAYLDKDGLPRPSVELVVHQVLTEYHVSRRRQAMRRPDIDPPQDVASANSTVAAPAEDGFDDDIPF